MKKAIGKIYELIIDISNKTEKSRGKISDVTRGFPKKKKLTRTQWNEKIEKVFNQPKYKLMDKSCWITDKLFEAKDDISKGKTEKGILAILEAMEKYPDFILSLGNSGSSRNGGDKKNGYSVIPPDIKAKVRQDIQVEIDKVKKKTKRGTWTWNHKEILNRAIEKLQTNYDIPVEFRTMNNKTNFPKYSFK